MLSVAMWWFFYIFNVFLLVYSTSTTNLIYNYSCKLLCIELLASIAVSASMVITVFAVDGKYSTFTVQVVLCGPPTNRLIYYTFSLPLQIFFLSGCILMALVIVRLRKVQYNKTNYLHVYMYVLKLRQSVHSMHHTMHTLSQSGV